MSEQYRDLIPGINVGAALAQLGSYVGLAPQGDYDIFDSVTLSDRQGQVDINPFDSLATSARNASAKNEQLAIPSDFDGATSYESWLASQQASANQTAKANEQASYDDQLANLERLLGFINTKRQQGVQSIEDQYKSTEGQQRKAFDAQRLQNTQNQEKGYNEVGQFANTSLNNLNRMLQGANAGRGSVGKILAPYMVNRSAEARRKAVTDTAGENARNIDLTAETTFQDLGNQRKKNIQDFESSIMGSQNEIEGQKRSAIINRGLASGMGYGQAKAAAAGLDASMNSRYAELTDLFNKYKPDYSIKEAPALSTYQVDPAKINAKGQSSNDFYFNMLKRKKDLNQGV